jgi:hypothetical protein
VGCCERDNAPSGSVKWGNFLTWLGTPSFSRRAALYIVSYFVGSLVGLLVGQLTSQLISCPAVACFEVLEALGHAWHWSTN